MGWVKTEKTNKLSKLGDIDFTTTAPVDGNALVYDETNDVWVPGEGGGGNANEMVLTQDEYDALTPEEQLNGTNYYINDASVGAQSAAGTPYDNSLSDLLATDVQDAIDELVMSKVDAVNGKGLSTEDYTTAEKTKLSGIASGANVNVQADWNEADTASDAYIANKPVINSYKILTDTLEAGQTSITFTDADILADSIISVATPSGINPTAMTSAVGSATFYFTAQSTDIIVKAVIF